MRNKEKICTEQARFFENLETLLSPKYVLVNKVVEVLGIGESSAYRRIRGETPLNFKEILTLCAHFGISLDALSGIEERSQMKCFYTPLDLKDENNLITYTNGLIAHLGNMKAHPGNEIILSASDIPLFSFSMFTTMVKFRFFSWSKNVYGLSKGYTDFINSWDIEKSLEVYNQIAAFYRKTSSTEIWSNHTIDAFIGQLKYHYIKGCFDDNRIPKQICEELLELIETLQIWTETGIKSPGEALFKFYINNTGAENTFILLKQPEKTICLCKLFTVNSLIISDKRFCTEMESWLRNLSQQATLITGGSAIERYDFFNKKKKKVRDFMDSYLNG